MFELLVLSLIIWVLLYLYFTRNFNHWKKKNVPFLPPMPFVGNAFKGLTLRESMGDFFRKIYNSTTEPFIGLFVCDDPYLLIRDPEIVKHILVKDFDVFNNRCTYDNKEDDPVGSNILFLMKTPEWREMRRKVSPIFTSGKMTNMVPLMKQCGEDMVKYIEEQIKESPLIDVRDVAARYTTNAISMSVFGIDDNCFKNKNSEFLGVSKRVFNSGILERAISLSCYFVAPGLVKWFKMRFVDKKSTDFLKGAFWETIKEREEKKFVRNDLLDILIKIKNVERIDDLYKLDGNKLLAQAVQFFIAGSETSSSTMTFTLYELAKNPNIQQTLREEIQTFSEKHGGIGSDSLREMKYLDFCIRETLRKYPILPFLDRRCNIDYQIPGTDVVLEKGTGVFISVSGMQYDPEYFPEPEKFDPLRFTKENVELIKPFTYLPFGEGPRHCIGKRFGELSSMAGIAHIIANFEVQLSHEGVFKLDTKGILLAPAENLFLKFRKIYQKRENCYK